MKTSNRFCFVLIVLIVLTIISCSKNTQQNNSSSDSAKNKTSGDVTSNSGNRLNPSGRWMTDNKGRTVILHGFNMMNKFPPYTVSSTGFGEEDAKMIADAGFNAMRVGIIYSGVEPTPGVYDDNYIDDIVKTVEMLNKYGILSLVDMHQDIYGSVFHGEGFPAWATLTDGLSIDSNYNFPNAYFESPAIQRAFDNFWNNTPAPDGIGLQDHYTAAWAHVAKRFANVEGVMGYDLMNEPFPGSRWKECSAIGCGDFDEKFLTGLYNKLIPAIRKNDASTIIFYEPNVLFDFGVATTVPVINCERLGFSFHPYVQTPRGLGMAQQHSISTGTALLASEWGATTDTSAILAGVNDMDVAMMSWLYWAWANKTPFNIPGGVGGLPGGSENQGIVLDLTKPRTPGNVHMDRLNALTRVYPRAITGIPVSFSFNHTTKVFEMVYKPSNAQGETEIFCPKIFYPNGYTVTVKGATVASRQNDIILKLKNDSGADVVEVEVKP